MIKHELTNHEVVGNYEMYNWVITVSIFNLTLYKKTTRVGKSKHALFWTSIKTGEFTPFMIVENLAKAKETQSEKGK